MFGRFFDQAKQSSNKKESRETVGEKEAPLQSKNRKQQKKDRPSSRKEARSNESTSKRAPERTSNSSNDLTDSLKRPAPKETRNERRKKRKRDPNQHTPSHSKTATRTPPSPQALALSKQLQDLSRQKNWKQALQLYYRSSPAVDSHHACTVVDCCARCGALDEAQALFDSVDAPSVPLQTALLKGYAHAGRMEHGLAIFRSMEAPNIRTLNTLLRGCLWTAVTREQGHWVGGVVSSEEAWELFQRKVGSYALDASSFEYSIRLLCQALQLSAAEDRIQAFQKKNSIQLKGKASFAFPEGTDASVLEVLAAIYLSLARAQAYLGEDVWISCQRCLNAAKYSVVAFEKDPTGKHAWKNQDERRVASNKAYRTHRLKEIASEAKHLIQTRGKNAQAVSRLEMAKRILKSVVYFSGGGTTGLETKRSPNDEEIDFVGAPALSFGVKALVQGDSKGKMDLSHKDTKAILAACEGNVLAEDGHLNLAHFFDDENLPLDVELGAGFGDWIVRQACAFTDRNHMGVELRADRVHQILSSAVLHDNSLGNLLAVGAEAGALLSQRLRPGSVSTVFVNHPEPPTQTYGADATNLQSIMKGGEEPSHMLSSATLLAAATALRPGGRLVIVTDNHWYGKLLGATLVKLIRQHKRVLLPDKKIKSHYKVTESFAEQVVLYEGTPSAVVGHAPVSGGASYFDRLWKVGASTHAETERRFLLVLQKP